MRLTNSTLLRGYNRDLQRLKTEKNACEKKITSTRKFSRASEAPLAAAKALNVRKSQYYSEQYKENLKVAQKFFTEAETSLLLVSEKMAEVRETLIAACNTTKDPVDYNIYAQQLETFAHELCAIFNTDSAGRAIFGGESDESLPFTIINDANGNPSPVLYHGVPVNSLMDYMGFPFSNPVYMDIGLGMVTDQVTHQQDPMSVLDISFNGAKITGCGAEYGIADIDLSSILENRNYCLDVYANGVKHTIAFRGQATPAENVAEIRAQLQEAFKKEAGYGKPVPTIDDQGMIYLVDKYGPDGKALEDGLVCVVNNTTNKNSSRVEKLVVENDSNYTNKYRMKLDSLEENKIYTMDVEVNGERYTIEFLSGSDDLSDPLNPVYREDETIKNLQAALDKAFGPDVVNVTDHAPNKGVLSSEGAEVKLYYKSIDHEDTAPMTYTTELGKLKIDTLEPNTKYNIKMIIGGEEKEVTFETGSSTNVTDICGNIIDALSTLGYDKTKFAYEHYAGVWTYDREVIEFLPAEDTDDAVAAPFSKDTITKIDYNSFEEGKSYDFTITFGGETKTITVEGSSDPKENYLRFAVELFQNFGNNITYTKNGEIYSSFDTELVEIAANQPEYSDENPFTRERIYSNNYIQLTLDAARALRHGDIEYANGCIDRIVNASEHLLAQIADIGCSEDFCDFNIERLTTREENLDERQNELEITDPEYQITLWKTFEAYYNACLQMSASVVPNSIFNYMK